MGSQIFEETWVQKDVLNERTALLKVLKRRDRQQISRRLTLSLFKPIHRPLFPTNL